MKIFINKLDLTDVYKTQHPPTVKDIIYSSICGTFIEIVLHHEQVPKTCKGL